MQQFYIQWAVYIQTNSTWFTCHRGNEMYLDWMVFWWHCSKLWSNWDNRADWSKRNSPRTCSHGQEPSRTLQWRLKAISKKGHTWRSLRKYRALRCWLAFLYIRRSNIIISLLNWRRTFWRRCIIAAEGWCSITDCKRLNIPKCIYLIDNAEIIIKINLNYVSLRY